MNSSAEIRRRLKRREDMFLRRLFATVAKMAKVDGRVDPWEVHAAEAAFTFFPRAAKRRRFCVNAFNDGIRSRYSLYWLAYDFSKNWAGAEDCLRLYEVLWEVACARDVVTARQLALLKTICRYLNLPGSYFDIFWRKRQGTVHLWDTTDGPQAHAENRRTRTKGRSREERTYRQPPPPRPEPPPSAYAVLGCTQDMSDEAVRRAYRLAAKNNHPDLLRAKGASEADLAASTARMAAINAAWDEVKRMRGL